jgi:hypothetical protein
MGISVIGRMVRNLTRSYRAKQITGIVSAYDFILPWLENDLEIFPEAVQLEMQRLARLIRVFRSRAEECDWTVIKSDLYALHKELNSFMTVHLEPLLADQAKLGKPSAIWNRMGFVLDDYEPFIFNKGGDA